MVDQKETTTPHQDFKPYVSAETKMKEFTFKSVFVGALLAIILGAANAYLGLIAGLTVAATFPAAVMAMAILRPFKGTILEENVCRTSAAVGEALVAGAIFTIPAFLIATKPGSDLKIWEDIHYLESTALMLLGGVLGVFFIIFLRRILIEDRSLPFPESVACSEIVKAGQGHATGAKYVFGAMGLGALLELLKNSYGIQLVKSYVAAYFPMKVENFRLLNSSMEEMHSSDATGGIFIESPSAQPAIIGVGYIIGHKLSAIVFSGGVFGHLMLVPLFMFVNSGLFGAGAEGTNWLESANSIWFSQVRPFAVGSMLVGAVYTLFKMRKSLATGIARAFRDLTQIGKVKADESNRLERDIPYSYTLLGIIILVIPIAVIYYFFCGSVIGAIVAAIVMTVAGFLFAAVAGFLVGTIGSSNNPISGLTLSTLILAALLMLAIGVTGAGGIAAVLGVAAVVCCSCGVAGDMIQDLKVGQILGGTPKSMEWGEIIGVIAAALVMVFPLQLLHNAYLSTGGIGGADLPAPQASLMAMLAQGIISGGMAWPLVIMGMVFSLGLIMIGSPSPMLIAVGMYLPLHTTAGIYVGGLIKAFVDARIKKQNVNKEKVENTGTLIASGLIAGEALMGIIVAGTVVYAKNVLDKESLLPAIIPGGNPWLGVLVIAVIAYILIMLPLRNGKK